MNKSEFTQFTSNWDSHRPLLWEALEATQGKVIEFGSGFGSTPFIDGYCRERKRPFTSYENNQAWIDQLHEMNLGAPEYIANWDDVPLHDIDVLFIDSAPGERRKVDIKRWANNAKILVVHDCEKAADHGYKMRVELSKFKYAIEYVTDGAGAMAVSNFINVTLWDI